MGTASSAISAASTASNTHAGGRRRARQACTVAIASSLSRPPPCWVAATVAPTTGRAGPVVSWLVIALTPTPSLTLTTDDPPWTPAVLRRGPMLVAGVLAAVGGAAVYLLALPALWRMSAPYGLLFTALGAAQLVTVAAVLARPTRRRVLLAAAEAGSVVLVWVLVRLVGVLPAPDPWLALDGVVGFTDDVCAGLEAVAVAVLVAVGVLGARPPRPLSRRVAGWVAGAPLGVLVVSGIVIGVAASSNDFVGAGFPAATVAPQQLPAGARSTVEYCRPSGVPLAMDLYTPPAQARRPGPAPVAMYVHGGALVLSDRQMGGLGGAVLASPEGSLFPQVQQQLGARGFVVASIDYRLAPAAPWPAGIEDTKCAVRFLRAHAAGLGIDPTRIGVWGGSAGGELVSLLGLAGPGAGFDVGQYSDQSSAVSAVVDMYGPADLTDFGDSAPFGRSIVQIGLGSSTAVRRSASPDFYPVPRVGAPPFLILQGSDDPLVRPHQSAGLAQRLQAAGVPTTLITVAGAGHGFSTSPDQHPTSAELTAAVTGFFTTTVG